jgi:hypothetical protein
MKYIKKFNESNTGEQTSNEILERSYNNWISDFEKGLDNKKLFALADTIAMTSRSSNPQAWLDNRQERNKISLEIKELKSKIRNLKNSK